MVIHVKQRAAFVMTARSPIERIQAYGKERGWAFQQYLSVEASQEFLQTSNYAGPPQVTALTPIWSKPA